MEYRIPQGDVPGGYWGITEALLAENQGRGPNCPQCGAEMSPADDHGRFICSCNLFRHYSPIFRAYEGEPSVGDPELLLGSGLDPVDGEEALRAAKERGE